MSEHRISDSASIAPGTTRPYKLGGVEVLLCNVDGEFYAIEDCCTHDGAPLDAGTLEARCIVCPRHGATFDVITGEALTLPAVLPVMTYPVRREGDELVVEV
ncbi:MAG TPA: non-heme iron oxygenase ferredoxin subunit [Candidatus Dormibacteraeota bacterium]|nr:non-heme iron oxygenase ferredoxin subunit [Candidatus Dormibacteraeota bacterium]